MTRIAVRHRKSHNRIAVTPSQKLLGTPSAPIRSSIGNPLPVAALARFLDRTVVDRRHEIRELRWEELKHLVSWTRHIGDAELVGGGERPKRDEREWFGGVAVNSYIPAESSHVTS